MHCFNSTRAGIRSRLAIYPHGRQLLPEYFSGIYKAYALLSLTLMLLKLGDVPIVLQRPFSVSCFKPPARLVFYTWRLFNLT